MTRFLVTGCAGFIGANLVERLKSQGHYVRGVDVKETPWRKHKYGQADKLILGKSGDLRFFNNADAAANGVERVYHLAADHGGAGYFHSDKDFKAALNNEAIDRNVMLASMQRGVERLFFASSACTYPTFIQAKGAIPLRESDWGGGPAEALYGERKRLSTLFMEGAREHGFDARSGIFHTIYGPGQDYLEPRAKFPTALCRKLIENPERVEVWGDGTQVRTFLYITDALDRIQRVMEWDYEGPVNIGSDEEVRIWECCHWAAEAAGVSPEWVKVDGPIGVDHRASDNTVWDQRYGGTKLISAKEGFAKLYDYMLETHGEELALAAAKQ